MQKIPFNFDWLRTEGYKRRFGAGQPEGTPVSLPDDFIISKPRDPEAISGASTGFYPPGRATYTKTFAFDAAWAGKTVLLDIDGAYMDSEVTLNGDLLALHPYGYTPFYVDLTRTLKEENTLTIITDSVQPSSRWYSGGGIYREVSLLLGGEAYLHPLDVFLYTKAACAQKAILHLDVEVTNNAGTRNLSLRLRFDGQILESRTVHAFNGKTPFGFDFAIEAPKLWSADTPNLYDVRVELVCGEEVLDVHAMKFGVRQIEIDSKNGMRVNGEPVLLRGGCIHHDNALLGARALPRAEERKIQALKNVGYNAVRSAHNPPSTALLEACDRIGMYVVDESFDMWRTAKNARDYHQYFEQWWEEDTALMVRRDRNHACVYCWSIGNEIHEMNGSSDGAYWAKVQADLVRSLDPSRPVTSALNPGVLPPGVTVTREPIDPSMGTRPVSAGIFDGHDYWGEGSENTVPALDMVGYNYLWPRYKLDAVKYPDRVIHATETHSWHMYDYWQAVKDNDNCIGDFTWTATDNLGEAGAGRVMWELDPNVRGLIGGWPWLSCYQGDLDLDMRRRPQSYYRGIVWGLDPGIHMFTTPPEKTGVPFYGMGWHWQDVRQNWTFDEKYIGQPVQLEAYCDCDEVEFLVNGVSAGRVPVQKYQAFLTVPYQPGKVEAVAYRDGAAYERTCLETTGAPAQIILEPDRTEIAADGMDLCYVAVRIADAEGKTVVRDDVHLVAEACDGELLAFGSANPCTEENYSNERNAFQGYALAVLRAGREPAEITLKVTAEGLPEAQVTIICK